MSHIPPSNPKTGISIVGLLLGARVETSRDQKYTNYRMGIATQSRPDNYGQVVQTTNEIELTEDQHKRLFHSIQANVNSPVRVWVDLDHRAGEKNGKVWEILNLRLRTDSEIEYLGTHSDQPLSSDSNKTTDLPAGVRTSK